MIIKGIINKELLEKKNLHDLRIISFEDSIQLDEYVDEIYEVEQLVKSNIVDIIYFNDMNLNIINTFLKINLICIKNKNDGTFFCYESSKLSEIKSFNNLLTINSYIINSKFELFKKSTVNFSIIIGIDISNNKNLTSYENPSKKINICNESYINKILDKEFI